MNKTLQLKTQPMPATKSFHTQQQHTYSSNSNSPDKLFLRPDCFGLGSFISAYDLQSEVGDLIQIDRVLYTDWALYVGNGNVVHVSSLDMDNNEIPSDTAMVRLSSLADVAGPSGVRVNNKSVGAKERGLEPLPLDEVLQNCYSELEKQVGFNMLTRNSEHYVTDWKYGRGWSDQVGFVLVSFLLSTWRGLFVLSGLFVWV